MVIKVKVFYKKNDRNTKKVFELLRGKNFQIVNKISDCDIVIIVGGTDLILKTLMEMRESKPFLGVSISGPGFLCETSIATLSKSLKKIIKNEHKIEEVTRIYCKDKFTSPPALNDVVITPSKSATIMTYVLKVDGETIWKDQADGLIISTPIGSTAYALSAGGPIVSRGTRTLLIVPINSLNPTIRPMVIDENSKIEICNIESKTPCEVIIDGQIRYTINGDVTIAKANPALLIKFDKEFSKLMRKLEKKTDISENLDISPSAKFIYKTLQHFGEMTQKEIEKECLLPRRTTKNALDQLLERGLIRKRTNLRDVRQSIYFIP
ncbi:MAG: N-acetylmuramoyl-L-alanine amidase [Candidatus Parvarchaeota archaeon]|nr:N-acetylmuramoyl-L-alanine amidase [Candidatus Jingweiarchaeum tengchongense]MCW1304717.1 N-acetylmuramoyl-L-alanine amidase [Candidatus Jingweiarchaeum tengchongense]